MQVRILTFEGLPSRTRCRAKPEVRYEKVLGITFERNRRLENGLRWALCACSPGFDNVEFLTYVYMIGFAHIGVVD
jgi:hypothetical protein